MASKVVSAERQKCSHLLLEACATGNLSAVKKLVCVQDNNGSAAAAANEIINSQHPINSWTGLHWAMHRKHAPIVRLLLDNGARIDIPAGSSANGKTCLDWARDQLCSDTPGTAGTTSDLIAEMVIQHSESLDKNQIQINHSNPDLQDSRLSKKPKSTMDAQQAQPLGALSPAGTARLGFKPSYLQFPTISPELYELDVSISDINELRSASGVGDQLASNVSASTRIENTNGTIDNLNQPANAESTRATLCQANPLSKETQMFRECLVYCQEVHENLQNQTEIPNFMQSKLVGAVQVGRGLVVDLLRQVYFELFRISKQPNGETSSNSDGSEFQSWLNGTRVFRVKFINQDLLPLRRQQQPTSGGKSELTAQPARSSLLEIPIAKPQYLKDLIGVFGNEGCAAGSDAWILFLMVSTGH